MYRSGLYLVRRNTSNTGWHAEYGNEGYLTDKKLGMFGGDKDFKYLIEAKKVCENHNKEALDYLPEDVVNKLKEEV